MKAPIYSALGGRNLSAWGAHCVHAWKASRDNLKGPQSGIKDLGFRVVGLGFRI